MELRTLADTGAMTTTGTEARHRGDLIVLAGPGAVAYADHARTFADGGGLYPWRGAPRRALPRHRIGRPVHMASTATVAVLGDGGSIDRLVALLSARLAGRPVGDLGNGPDRDAIDAVALQMKAAAFGVVVYDPADFDHVALDGLMALVRALNDETRFTTLAVPAHHHGRGANLVTAWNTGDRLPIGLGRGYPEQDDWRFDVERAVASARWTPFSGSARSGRTFPAGRARCRPSPCSTTARTRRRRTW